MLPAIVPDAYPPIPLVTSHSRDSAASRLPQSSRPNFSVAFICSIALPATWSSSGGRDPRIRRVDAQRSRLRFNMLHRLLAEPHAAPWRFDVELVNEGVYPAVLKAEAQGQNNVANGRFLVLNEPSSPKFRTSEKLFQGHADFVFIKRQ